MCRFVVYTGQDSVVAADLLTRPVHSIIKQSFDSKLRQPTNADGFGLGWYDSETGRPCVYISILPAWNNRNFLNISECIRSKLLFSHVRAASTEFSVISETNCHPWQLGKFMFMHNGCIPSFYKIRKRLLNELKEELFSRIHGNTDSEHMFGLFLNQFDNPMNLKATYDVHTLQQAVLRTIQLVTEWLTEADIDQPATMNFAVTDGQTVIATRYVTHQQERAASLFFSTGHRFEQESQGCYRMTHPDRRTHTVLIASEPLTYERLDWMAVPRNTMITVTPQLNVLFHPIPHEK